MHEQVMRVANYGAEPGLRFAVLLDGCGGCRTLDMEAIRRWTPDDGVIWLHFERDHPAAAEWVTTRGGFDPLVADALLQEESRPRVESIDDGLLIILRSVCAAPPEEEKAGPAEIDLVPLHIWADEHRLVTLRDSGHYITALRDIRLALDKCKGPRQTGELLALVSEKLVRDLEPVLAKRSTNWTS